MRQSGQTSSKRRCIARAGHRRQLAPARAVMAGDGDTMATAIQAMLVGQKKLKAPI
jgi:hypothetical protein